MNDRKKTKSAIEYNEERKITGESCNKIKDLFKCESLLKFGKSITIESTSNGTSSTKKLWRPLGEEGPKFWFVFNNDEAISNFSEVELDFFIIFRQNSHTIVPTGKWILCSGKSGDDFMVTVGVNERKSKGHFRKKESEGEFVIENMNKKDSNAEIEELKNWLSIEEVSKIIRDVIDMEENEVSGKIEEDVKNAIVKNKQVIFTGAPGTGKTYTVREVVEELCEKKEERFKFVQFHSSYDYTDFVEGLRPAKVAGAENTTFVRMDGIFKAFCRTIVEDGLKKVRDNDRKYEKLSDEELLEIIYKSEEKNTNKLDIFDETEKYYFIVDEINRADLGKVFGELMFGLEESYRGIKNRFDTQYMNLPTYIVKDGVAEKLSFDCFKNGFFIPKNLHFIGTMNDIDRSVESFDFALRRRFQWIEIKANDIMRESLISMCQKAKEEATEEKGEYKKYLDWIMGRLKNTAEDSLCSRIYEMNNQQLSESSYGLSDAYHIGPAYFKEIFASQADETEENYTEENYTAMLDGALKDIFEQKIAPIIREYLRGRKTSDIQNTVKDCSAILIDKIIDNAKSKSEK